ncbi:MAG: glycoside hydrolase family 3 [Desulfobacterales bacterium SG8_35]|nr:MAG: glycoside hydrolase family 3 [Desulfobacterales bacterium SG8_35]
MTSSYASADLSELGRLFMVGLPGLTLDESSLNLIQNHGINNFIYFKRNVESPEQLKQLAKDLRQACRENDLPPPLIAIDQEGGSVARLPPPFTQFPDARLLAESEKPEKALTDYAQVCSRELKAMGINYNLAPVVDVSKAGKGFFMERRSLGGDSKKVCRLGSLIIREMQANAIAACAKHFPGLGAAVVDPHFQLPFVTKSESGLRLDDLPPFRQAIKIGVASIMTSHTIYQHLDPEKPATLSKKILTGLLRNELGYEGVVITDDLEMGAIEKEGDLGHAALQAFEAGADLILICQSHEKAINAFQKTAGAIRKNPEMAVRMQESLARVAKMRQKFARE